MEILAATNNENKVREFNKMFRLNGLQDVTIINPSSIEDKKVEPKETGSSGYENAEIKALTFYEAFKMPCFADDSSLNVEVLHGAPGINSSRYAGENASSADNRIKLIDTLKSISNDKKFNAYFECIICFYDGSYINFFKGKSYGEIILEERGEYGFGYDSIFIPSGFDQTFGEILPDTKNIISHRAKAMLTFSESIKKGLISR